MAKDREIIYEPHPVSAERKRELIAAGYKIMDARFAPAGHFLPDSEEALSEVTAEVEEVQAESDGLDELDAEQLHALAKDRGVNVHHKAGADKVREVLRQQAKAP